MVVVAAFGDEAACCGIISLMNYETFISISLTSVTVLLAAVAVGLAVAAFFGWNLVSVRAEKIAEQIAKDTAGEIAKSTAEQIAKSAAEKVANSTAGEIAKDTATQIAQQAMDKFLAPENIDKSLTFSKKVEREVLLYDDEKHALTDNLQKSEEKEDG